MKGWDAVRILRAVAPRLEVVVTAAANSPEVERQVRETNIAYYHIKSFDSGELVQAVEELCGCPSRAGGNAMHTAGAKVLIVDDDPDMHEALKGILEVSGFQVLSAFSKAEGMEKVRADKPDVIILDVMMETLTAGFHFARELRQDPQLKHIPILSVSAVSEKTGFKFSPLVDQDFFPVDDFVEKPVRAKDLISRLNALIGRRAHV
jgi:CheY-like chemotaxis protein